MSVDGWIRRAALLAIPLIAGGLFLARGRAPSSLQGTSSDVATSSSGVGRDPAGVGFGDDEKEVSRRAALARAVSERGEAALGTPVAEPSASASERHEPLPAATSAADLPLAGSQPSRRSGRAAPTSRAPSATKGSACGGIEVKLITASEDPEWAFASLSPALGEEAVVRRIGQRIGGWQVDKIEWDRVWLRGGGGRCAVGMHFGAREAEETLPGGKRARLAAELPDEKPWRVPGEIANSIDKLGETEFSVEKALVPAIFDRAGQLLSGLSIEPVKHGEDVVGLELGEVQTDSLLERLGVETGDVVLAIDDEPVRDLDALLRALGGVRDRERLVAKLQRNGEAFELRVITR
jgi:hypothetical protein